MSKLNNGREINKIKDTNFAIKTRNGKTIEIDISMANTVGDLLNDINNHPENMSGLVLAEIATDKNSIELIDFTDGNNELTLVNTNGSNLVEGLGFVNSEGNINKSGNGKISTVIPEKFT